ncbi:hypothetical protein PAHAL_2G015700 [Panicum hallii]|nr:uncharacterized protein LOC112882529 isoform X2 [Panicum hallii]XP_025803393.1 uncharacterized protein LOC112882529 isoform X2 [Panicum hallii]PVH63373.1 hypothetical protein PAHAL_2G015700 [Panicum hallii]
MHGGENHLNHARHSNVSSTVVVGDGTDTHGGGNHSNQSADTSNSNSTGAQSSRISKVRAQLRAGDHNSYTPHFVTIGPYNRTPPSPQAEHIKLICVEFMERKLREEEGAEGGGLAHVVEPLVPRVRACYDHDTAGEMTTEALSTLLLRDGCYLLGTTCNLPLPAANNPQAPPAPSNNVNAAAAMHVTRAQETASVRDTVFLLENQIPFVVLEAIHERVTGGNRSLLQSCLGPYVRKLLVDLLYISPWVEVPSLPEPPSHLLHLVHTYFKSPVTEPQQRSSSTGDDNTASTLDTPLLPIRSDRTGRWRRATEYCKYGDVRFKRRNDFKEGERWTFLDVRHDAGTLWIPLLRVDGMTWTILRNLMALEEQQEERRPVTAYCVFMSQVACTVEDVELLQRRGILEQFLGSDEEVAKGFANLCKGVIFDVDIPERNYLRSTWHELHKLCCDQGRNFMGSFRQKHWSEPLVRAGFGIAFCFFVFQLLQVILTFIPLVHKRNK